MDDVARIVSERINRLGVSETDVRSQGNDRVVVELPGVKDPEEAVRILGTTARMEFRKVPEKYEYDTNPGPGGRNVITFKDKSAPDKLVPHQIVYYEAPEFNGDKNVLVGSHLGSNSVIVTFDQENKPAISLELNREGSARFDAFASENQNKLIAMFLDRRCIDVRSLKERHYGGKVLLTGGFATPREAKELKILLEAGALPVPVDVVEQRTVSATLGADSVNQSRRAAVAGLILILLTMVALYRMPGFLATLALIEYGMIVLAIMTVLEFTLTLPGILGFILSVGMAVDGNVISFERLKEELRESRARPIAQCIRNSYELSFDAIFDGNITTIISAAVLMALGTGPIKGFGVTLFIGTWVSMVSALYVTRTWQNLVAATKIGQNRRWYRG
ncbi:MAG: protein translocase subunit SecD [Fimbriimonadaceae bacterium]|nr:protein translocase subunit SecD [Fimbriimonadaceae bacterium]